MQKSVKQEGSSLIEIAIVSFLIVTVLTALVSLTTMTIARNRLSKERAVATRLAQEVVEWLRFERERLGFKAMETTVNTSYDDVKFCMLELSNDPGDIDQGLNYFPPNECTADDLVNDKYTRNIHLDSSDSRDSITYTVTVSWPKAGGEDETITLTGVLNQWQ